MLALVLSLVVPTLLHARDGAPPRPVLTLHITFPFDIEGSNGMPVFVLYDNFVAIYRTTISYDRYPRFASAKLKPEFAAQLLDLATSKAFLALDSAYDLAPGWTDQASSVIRVWSDGQNKIVTVRGYGPSAPEPFATLFKRLTTFRAPGGRTWLPDSLNVTLIRVDSSCAAFAPVAWPSALPLPATSMEPRLVRYGLPIRYLSRVQKLRKEYGNWDCTPVSIGRTYWELWYDYPFPNDSAWNPR
jgi:hypothetical protein